MRPKKIGLIVNPQSGLGPAYNLEIARLLVQILEPDIVYTGQENFGGDAITQARVLAVTELVGSAVSQSLALMAVQEGIDALVVIGGDGTMADIAFALHQNGLRCPILGIGAGSINAGELVMCKANQVAHLVAADFEIKSISALEASCNGNMLGVAFNDIVIGTTIVGTAEGTLCDLDANDFLNGKRITGIPRSIGSQSATVTKTSLTKQTVIETGMSVGTVIAGFAHSDCFFGKAIVGGVCLTSLVGVAAGCLVCDQPLVRTQLDRHAHLDMEPIRSAYVSLSEDEVIEVRGLTYPAVLCADGNPLKALQIDDITRIQVRPNAVDVLRIAHH